MYGAGDTKAELVAEAGTNVVLTRQNHNFCLKRKVKPEPNSSGIFLYLEHFATMAQVLFSLKSYIASVSYDNVL